MSPSHPRSRVVRALPVLCVLLSALGCQQPSGEDSSTAEEDYRRKERYWFSSLQDVVGFLESQGFSPQESREGRELDAP